MIRSVKIIFLLLIAQHAFSQMPFTKKQLIGTWELDRGTAKGCVDGFVKPIIFQGQIFITFNDSVTYTTLSEGNYSNGYYIIDHVTNDILFDPLFDQATLILRPYRMKVVSIGEGVLTFLIEDACGIYELNYLESKLPR